MKKFGLGVFLLVGLLLFSACAGPAGTQGPPGPAGLGLEPKTQTFDISIDHQDSYARAKLIEIGAPKDTLIATYYRWQPPVIVVNKGDTVVLNIANYASSRIHSFVLPAFGLNSGDQPPTPAGATPKIVTLKFVADKAGTFEYICGVPFDPAKTPVWCSPEHEFQIGWLTVLDR